MAYAGHSGLRGTTSRTTGSPPSPPAMVETTCTMLLTIPLPRQQQALLFFTSSGESECTEDRLDPRWGFAHEGLTRRPLPCCSFEEFRSLHRVRKPIHHLVSRLFVLAQWQLCRSHEMQLALGCSNASHHLWMWSGQCGGPLHLRQPLADALVLDEPWQVDSPHRLDVGLGVHEGFPTEYRSAEDSNPCCSVLSRNTVQEHFFTTLHCVFDQRPLDPPLRGAVSH